MDDDLTSRVERALLGALITDFGLAQRLEYVELRDFADDLHRVIYTAIRLLRDATATTPGERIAAVAHAAGGQVSEEYVRELAASCPDPRHGTAYGLRLIQAALYREVSQGADALAAQAAAETPVVQTGADSGPQASGAARYLGLVSDALRRHTAALAPTGPASAPAAEPRQPAASPEQDARPAPETTRPARTPDQATGQATAVQSSGAPPARLATPQELREEHVLTALLQQHRESDQIMSFLPAAAFTSPERQEIFRAIGRLRQASQPVDELTVIWELRVGSNSSSSMLGNSAVDYGTSTSTSVMRLASASSVAQSPSQAARELLRQLDRRTASYRQPARRAQPGQAPVQGSPSATAGLPATQAPEAGGPQQGREPMR